MRALALMPVLWAVAWLIVDGAGAWLDATAAFSSPSRCAICSGSASASTARPIRRSSPTSARPPARPLLRDPLPVLGARRHGRAGSRRLPPRGRAVRRSGRSRPASASSPRPARSRSSASSRCAAPAADPGRRAGGRGVRRRRPGRGVAGGDAVEWRTCWWRRVEDPLSPDAEPARAMPSRPRIRRSRGRDLARSRTPAQPAELSAAGLTWIHLDAPPLEAAAGARGALRVAPARRRGRPLEAASGRRSTTTPTRATSSPSSTSRPTTRRSSG